MEESAAARELLFTQVPWSTSVLDKDLVRMSGVVASVLDLSIEEAISPGTLYVGPAPSDGILRESAENRTIGDYWFELLHVIPRSIDFGNILSTIQVTLDVYNAYRYETRVLEDVTNDAGEGTEIIDLPSLPVDLPPQTSLLLTLQVSPSGTPSFDTTLDFDTDASYLLQIPITGTRIVMFPFIPETGIVETLEFLTDRLESMDGSDQRVSLRYAPRQAFDLEFKQVGSQQRTALELLMFDWQSRVFGLPIWTETTFLTGAVAVNDTVINVADTEFSDFRVGGLAIIFESETKFDALEVTGVGATTLTFGSPIQNAYAPAVKVMPLLPVITSDPARVGNYANNVADFAIRFRSVSNTRDISDIGSWPTLDSKIILDEPNLIQGTLDGSISRRLTIIDNQTGIFSQTSDWGNARLTSVKTFFTSSRETLWATKQLIFALRGRQTSFYLPTFKDDLTLAAFYNSGSSTMVIQRVGFARYGIQRNPFAAIRITLTNGTQFDRLIINSSEIDATTELIELNASIGQDIAVAQVQRIEFLQLVCLDSDVIEIEHDHKQGEATISIPVRTLVT